MNWVQTGEKCKVEMRRSVGGSLSAANQCAVAALTHTKEDFLRALHWTMFAHPNPCIAVKYMCALLQLVNIYKRIVYG